MSNSEPAPNYNFSQLLMRKQNFSIIKTVLLKKNLEFTELDFGIFH